MPKLIKLLPRYTVASPPVEDPTRMTHLQIAKTEFGGSRPTDLLDWYWGPPLYRCVKQMSGPGTDILDRNPDGIWMPYCLLWSAVGDLPSKQEYQSYWVQLAEQWATNNGYNVEGLWLHAALDQHNKVSDIASIAANGTLTLGLKNARQVYNTIYNVGDEFVISGALNADGTLSADFNGPCTILSKVGRTQVVIDKTSSAGTTKGSFYQLGNGTNTLDNRFWFFLWDNWRYTMNPGTAAGTNWSIFKHGQTLYPGAKGIFYDEFDSGDVKGTSLEYATNTDYQNAIILLLSQIKAAYPGTMTMINTGSYSKQMDMDMGTAAGAMQMEQFPSVFSYSPTATIAWIRNNLANGTFVEIPVANAFRYETTTPEMYLPSRFRSSGGHIYQSPEARCMVLQYALYMQLVDSDIRPYGSYHLYWNCLCAEVQTVNPKTKWFPIHEHNLGKAMGPDNQVISGNIAQDGGFVRIMRRRFTRDGTNPYCLMLYYMSRGGNDTDAAKKYDSTTQYTVAVEPAPTGMQWWFLDEFGVLKYPVADSIALWCAEAIFLIAVPI